MTQLSLWWGMVGPWLLLVWLVQRLPWLHGLRGAVVSAIVASVAVSIPWFGHALPWWSMSLSANFSVTMAVLLVVTITDRAFGTGIFRKRDWNAAWTVGAAAGLLLYPSALGLGARNFDSYSLGWPWLFWKESLVLFGAASITAAVLLWRGNRFGYVLLAVFCGYAFRFQESQNFWD